MQGNGASESWLPSIPDLDGQARQAPRAGMRDALDAAACANGVVGQRIRLSAAAILRQPPFVRPQMQIQGPRRASTRRHATVAARRWG
jgi:hypothetical protein